MPDKTKFYRKNNVYNKAETGEVIPYTSYHLDILVNGSILSYQLEFSKESKRTIKKILDTCKDILELE